MWKTNGKPNTKPIQQRIVVQGKKGSYNIPVKLLKQQQVKQEALWKEYWE